MVELNGSNVVEMAVEGEDASSALRFEIYGASRLGLYAEIVITLTPDLDFVVVATSSQQRTTRVDSDAANGTYNAFTFTVQQAVRGKDDRVPAHLRVPQICRLRLPCGNSIVARSHCEATRRAEVESDGKQVLGSSLEINKSAVPSSCMQNIPFTRLLLDSNFVSMTDMAGSSR